MIDGVSERLSTYRGGIERISALIDRRAELIVALPPLREQFDAAIAEASDRILAIEPVSERRAGSPRRCWRTTRRRPSRPRKACGR